MNIPSKILKPEINDVEIGVGDIHIYLEDEIEEAQIGYSMDEKGNPNADWIGEKYIVIGDDSCCGDPIIADISDEKLPVYSMFHDDWSSLSKIANSFDDYMNILKMIDEADLSDEEEKDNLIASIEKMIPNEGKEYWESAIQVAYEFLNDIE